MRRMPVVSSLSSPSSASPSTMWQPEETVDHPVSEHRSSFDAANALVNFVLFDHVNRWFESEGEAIVLREDQENGL